MADELDDDNYDFDGNRNKTNLLPFVAIGIAGLAGITVALLTSCSSPKQSDAPYRLAPAEAIATFSDKVCATPNHAMLKDVLLQVDAQQLTRMQKLNMAVCPDPGSHYNYDKIGRFVNSIDAMVDTIPQGFAVRLNYWEGKNYAGVKKCLNSIFAETANVAEDNAAHPIPAPGLPVIAASNDCSTRTYWTMTLPEGVRNHDYLASRPQAAKGLEL